MALTKTLQVSGQGSTTAQSSVWIVDQWPNGQNIGVGISFSGAVTVSVQGAYDDFKPNWDLVANTATWFNTNIASATTSTNGTITGGPYTMLRLNTTSGTGTATAKFVQGYAGRAT